MDEWRHIEGWPAYEISNSGSVRRNDRLLRSRINKKDGYVYYSLFMAPNKWTAKAHRLVAMHFLTSVPGKHFVDHIDGNKLNNNVANLRWCTFQENIDFAWASGAYKNIGSMSALSILNEDKVREIKTMLKHGVAAKEIMKHFGTKVNAIYDIKQGRTWKHVI